MLVTKLKPGDILQVGDAQLLVKKITGSTVRLSIHAPSHVEIHRLQPLQPDTVQEDAPAHVAAAHEVPDVPAPLPVRRSRS